jgi:serine/threonine-protein kinase HipA
LGALIFEPDYSFNEKLNEINLDNLASEAQEVLDGTSDEVLTELIALNGSSAGARPKALIGVNQTRDHIIYGVDNLPQGYQPWIVKFPNGQDGLDAGAIEYVYALMAKAAGITMPDIHLFTGKRGAGYFAIKRFDREENRRYHMHTVAGLLHSDFRIPSLDYEDLLALTSMLTGDVREVKKMYQLAVFNVLAHNRDDHGKNFSFLMDQDGKWKLSPAYDLTFSSGPHGEQSMTVMGEGRNPKLEHLTKLALEANLSKQEASEIIEVTRASLGKWTSLAKLNGVSHGNMKLISKKIC